MRGEGLSTANSSAFANPALYSPWATNQFMVSVHEKKFANYDKMAVLLRYVRLHQATKIVVMHSTYPIL